MTLAGASGLTLLLPRRGRAATRLRVSTWAAPVSPAGKVLQAWAGAVAKKTAGAVEIALTWRHGDWESRIVKKLQKGDLDVAMLRRPALDAFTDAMALLELPGGVASWADLDAARARIESTVRQEVRDSGGTYLAAADQGLRHLLSDRTIRLPSDLDGLKTYVPLRDPLTRAETAVLKYRKLELPDTDLGRALVDGVVDVVPAAPLWVQPGPKQMHGWVWGASVGMLVANRDRLDALAANHRQVVVESAEKAGSILAGKLREAADGARDALEKRATVIKPTSAEWAAWQRAFAEIRGRLEKKHTRHLPKLKSLPTYQTTSSL